MRWLNSFLVEGMQGMIEENYIYIVENKNGLWIYTPLDDLNIPVIGIYRTHCEARVKEILQTIWANNHIYVSVRKIASSKLEDSNARK